MISLNKEMLEKIKSLNGKIKLTTAAFALGVGLTLTGCGDVDAVEPTTPVTSEVVSEEVSEVVSEEISEEVSEEISEEVVEEETYSAQEVMTLVDELTTKYQYNNPEHIKALVIAANLDYITAEDLDIILATYGYTMEDLAVLYDECILDNGAALQASFDYRQGNIDNLSVEETYSERFTISSVALNDLDKENAKWYDQLLFARATGGNYRDSIAEFHDNIAKINDDMTNFEEICYSYTYGTFHNDLSYAQYLQNPYINYSKVNVK